MMETTSCPTQDDLTRMARGDLPEEQFESICEHLEACSPCEQQFADIDDPADSFSRSLGRITSEDLESARAAIEPEALKNTATSIWNSFASVLPEADQRSTLTTPCQLGQYEVLRMIAHGGMGEVYEARHVQLEVPRAVKVIRGTRQDDPVSYRYFLKEMKTIGALEHPNLVRAYDAWENDGCLFLVLELLEGDSLQTLIRKAEIETVAEVIAAMLGTCRGLEQLHAKQLIHRDVKPANIMRLTDGSIKLIDFGLAIDNDSGQSVGHSGAGTRGYMSPEQDCGSETIDHRSDIYSAGRVLTFLLQESADAPADSNQANSVSELKTLAEWMTQPDVKSRPTSIHAVIEQLENLQQPVVPPPTAPEVETTPTAPPTDHPKKVSASRSNQGITSAEAAQAVPRIRRRGIGWRVWAAVLIGIFGLGAYQIVFNTDRITTVVVENHQPGDVLQISSQDGKVRSIELGAKPTFVVDPGHYTLSLKDPGNRRLSPADIQVTGLDRLTVRIEDIPGDAGGVQQNQPDVTSPLSNTPPVQGPPAESASPTQLAGPTITNTVGMKLKLIPPGEFLMGSPVSEEGREDGAIQHRVKLTKSFYLGQTEVTQGQWKAVMGTQTEVTQGNWKAVMGTTPWDSKHHVKEGDDYPATFVSWTEAVAFCRKLSEKEGVEYRLPTEAEWEYACRAGTTTKYSFGDDESELSRYGWWGGVFGDGNGNAQREQFAHRVRLKRPNSYGLYDMHGNVWEWCQDWYGTYPSGPVTDPSGPSTGSKRVLRGGSWDINAESCRSAIRGRSTPSHRFSFWGFRVVRSSGESTKKPVSGPATTEKTPDVATVKKTLTPAQLAVGDSIENSIGMVLVPIPAGQFLMGSPVSEAGREEGETQHRVKLTNSFYRGQTELTQGQWKAVMGTTPWKGKAYAKHGDDYPATGVNWNEAVAFCRKLSAKEGVAYRLPTEAEWEYACRAETTTAYSFGDDLADLGNYAWFAQELGDGARRIHTVGQKKPNPWGLYDMHGNVYEWCQDWKSDYPTGDVTDPWGPSSGSDRVIRGGGWIYRAWNCRSALRDGHVPNDWNRGHISVGFRVLRSSSANMPDAASLETPLPVAEPAGDPIENSIGMVLVPIPAGEFMMGSPVSEEGRDDGEIQHRVKLTKSFYLGQTEVTQGQWKAVMRTTPWKGKRFVKEGDDYAATCMQWSDTVRFCRKLSAKEGVAYRLPTEAEWEYACRAGTTTAYSFGDDPADLGDYARFAQKRGAVETRSHTLGQKQPNPWGLYNMHGNVHEWCQDLMAEYPSGDVTDPTDSASFDFWRFGDDRRVFRGGSWVSGPRYCRSAVRNCTEKRYTRHVTLGFRVLRCSGVKTPLEKPLPIAKPVGDPIENSIGMVLVPISAGEFMMGSPVSEKYRDDDETQHRVKLTQSFHLGQTEVTQGQWQAVMGTTPWKGEQVERGGDRGVIQEGDNYAATYVSWHDAVAFCRKLSEKDGVAYRLPTEAEWEYACRAGTTAKYSFGDDTADWDDYVRVKNRNQVVSETLDFLVGQKKPNLWGLYDMPGNVHEWCQDWKAEYPSGDVTDPCGPSWSMERVVRGSSCPGPTGGISFRSAQRYEDSPSERSGRKGFRVLRSSGVKMPLAKPLPVARPVGDPLENSIGMVLVPIPAGEFLMGSPESKAGRVSRWGREDDEIQHRVKLTQSFHLGRTEVTQGQWQAVMGTAPWKGKRFVKEGDDYSATWVSWNDAVAFCRKLSEKEGVAYRLPTEAEWEYACRAGTTTAYSCGDDPADLGDYAWFAQNVWSEKDGPSRESGWRVAARKPNPWGLYDMHGNAHEWCQDWKSEYPAGDATDPVGPPSGSFRASRGGSWSFDARYCRSARRGWGAPSNGNFFRGFRVLRSSAK